MMQKLFVWLRWGGGVQFYEDWQKQIFQTDLEVVAAAPASPTVDIHTLLPASPPSESPQITN